MIVVQNVKDYFLWAIKMKISTITYFPTPVHDDEREHEHNVIDLEKVNIIIIFFNEMIVKFESKLKDDDHWYKRVAKFNNMTNFLHFVHTVLKPLEEDGWEICLEHHHYTTEHMKVLKRDWNKKEEIKKEEKNDTAINTCAPCSMS